MKWIQISSLIVSSVFITKAYAATYYVSPVGNDKAAGTKIEQPFQHVQYAIKQMKAGDKLIVLDGLYSEKIILKSGISIQAKNPRKAIFSGVETFKGQFESHGNGVYKAPFKQNTKQLFYKNQPMTWAQWPNVTWKDNWREDKKWASATDGTGPGVLTSNEFSEISTLDLAGGYVFLRYGKGNSNYSRLIESFDGRILAWNDDNFYNQKYTGEDGRRGSIEALKKMPEKHAWHPNKSQFFIAGDIDLLDAPSEWFADGDTLYFYPPDGKQPSASQLLVKTEDYCIEESAVLSDVSISGIDFFACSVKLINDDNKNIAFKDSHFTYIGGELLFPDRIKGNELNKPIELSGDGLLIDKSLFAGAQNSALKIVGKNFTIRNSVFMENNRNANFESRAIVVEATGSYQITRNTFFNNHSDAIMIRTKIKKPGSVNPDVSYNNIFNSGKYNSDVSGIYMPTGSQMFAQVHHNWIHNNNGNAFRLDLAGSQLSLHHNVFWGSKRGINVEGYGEFNIYNNTDVHNHVSSALTRNVLNHARQTRASLDKTFPPISDWNVLNNISDALDDRVGPREKKLLKAQMKKGLVHPERNKQGNIAVIDRGAIQGNLTGKHYDLFINAELAELNLQPKTNKVRGGVSQTEKLRNQGVTALGSYRGAYDFQGDSWIAGSDWMPYGLKVIQNMKEAEQFAKQYYSESIVPTVRCFSH
ncbi:right-handed parallel beta-helix repeat-containing protein [Thalassotalea sp. HSM 43]|uniref:right-handed parallel beta-helix repeat-containing protein n=1 Tax=Thalassotalea sp. HSM 43 TaxID=2552945 RepID=UPI0010812A7B|nr:right-handed parallel beta-helix repeat-containing protein [Thalassotalea sp. HSM 43]QBY03571.1 right-handed parallel beta-helix repeat-containing protein [Thalassotalea sp. HSM 43]